MYHSSSCGDTLAPEAMASVCRLFTASYGVALKIQLSTGARKLLDNQHLA